MLIKTHTSESNSPEQLCTVLKNMIGFYYAIQLCFSWNYEFKLQILQKMCTLTVYSTKTEMKHFRQRIWQEFSSFYITIILFSTSDKRNEIVLHCIEI